MKIKFILLILISFIISYNDTYQGQSLNELKSNILIKETKNEFENGLIEDKSLEISGFVNASYYYNKNSKVNSFTLDQVEIDITKEFSENASLRADVEYVNDGTGGFTADLEQGYLFVNKIFRKDLSITFGKFNAPIGFELLDAPNMFQYSHAHVFNLGLPKNLTGIMISSQFSDISDLSLYIVNGWDMNVDNNKDKTIGGRLGFYISNGLNIGFSGIYGAQRKIQGDKLKVADIDITYIASEALLFGGEINFGSEDITAWIMDYETGSYVFFTDKNKWYGLLAMFHYDFNESIGITGRYDYFYDKGASRTGIPQKLNAITIAPTFAFGNGLGGFFEIRFDSSDKETFIGSDGKVGKNNITTAFALTFTF